jgi:hypothetical protein
MKLIKFSISILVLLCWSLQASGQEINFGEFGNYTLTIGELNAGDLDFGVVTRNGGLYSVGINNSKILTITGVKYLDVIIDVTAQNEIYLNGNPANAGDAAKAIPFTLEAAFANNEGTPTVAQSRFINVTGNTFLRQFPVLKRQNRPPGPPPPPPTNAFDQSQVEEIAYLYLYGSINVGNVDAGSYSSDIIITINYD